LGPQWVDLMSVALLVVRMAVELAAAKVALTAA
jgi:hypothetical protein